MNLPPISISWLRHCGEFKSHQKLPFRSKMHQNRWRLDPAGGAYSAPPGPLAVTGGGGGEGRGGEGGEGTLRFFPPTSTSWLRHW